MQKRENFGELDQSIFKRIAYKCQTLEKLAISNSEDMVDGRSSQPRDVLIETVRIIISLLKRDQRQE